MEKLLLGLLLAWACLACGSNPGPAHPTLDSSCADRFELANVSGAVVPGAFACLSPGIQKLIYDDFGIRDDAGLASFAGGINDLWTAKACGPMAKVDATHNARTYLLSDQKDQTRAQLDRLWVNVKSGRIDEIEVADNSGGAQINLSQVANCATLVDWLPPHYLD